MPKWWIGSTDGKNYVISKDPMDLPHGARPAPINCDLTDSRLDRLIPNGGSVRIHGKKEDRSDAMDTKRGR